MSGKKLMHRPWIKLPALILGVASCFFIANRIIAQARFSWPAGEIPPGFAETGEALIHDLHPPDQRVSSFYMPLKSVFGALLYEHYPAAIESFSQCDIGAGVLLIIALCLIIAPLYSFMPAAALIASHWGGVFTHGPPEPLPRLVLLVAFFLVWRAQAPSNRRNLLLGAALGVSLLYRSNFAFFPPLLALIEWFSSRAKRPWRALFFLGIFPYLFLLPWIIMNAVVHHRFVAFEDGGASSNIVSGALGSVETIEGDLGNLVGKSLNYMRTGTVLGWAVREISNHPVRYLLGVMARLRLVLSYHPLLFLFALIGAFLGRKRDDIRHLALLCAYLIFIHCLMAVERRYFDPLWPLLAVLGAFSIASLWEETRSKIRVIERGAALTGALACHGIVLAAGVYTAWTVSAYAATALRGEPRYRQALDQALAARPTDAWLWKASGEGRLQQGDAPGAAHDLKQASLLRRKDPVYFCESAWAQMLAGDAAPLLSWEFLPQREGHGRDFIDTNAQFNLKAHLYKGYASMKLGKIDQARAHVLRAKELHESMTLVRGRHGARENAILARLRAPADQFLRTAFNALNLERQPLRERLGFIELIALADPLQPTSLTCLANFLIETCQLREEGADFDPGADGGPEPLVRVLLHLALRVGDHDLSAALLRRTAEVLPTPHQELASLRGRIATIQEGRAVALRLLGRAESLTRGDADLHEILSAYLKLSHYRDAARALKRLPRLTNEESALLADLAFKAGNRASALDSLKEPSPAPHDADWHTAALLYQSLEEHRRALAILKRLALKQPRNAKYFNDLAVSEFRLGAAADSIMHFETAVELDPRLACAHYSLGTAYSSQKMPLKALKHFDAALALLPESSPLRALVLAGRRKIGQEKDFAKVLASAKKGDPRAQDELGLLYQNGNQVPQNLREALKWLTKAAEQGYAPAQFNLGNMHYLGRGIERDYQKAALWYRKAAERGYAKAQNNLGFMYDGGLGLPKDPVLSFAWYLKAANQGDGGAQAAAGYIYESGRTVKSNYAEAYKWYALASARNNAKAKEKLEALSRQMTAGEIAEGKKRSAAFVEPQAGLAAPRAKPNSPSP